MTPPAPAAGRVRRAAGCARLLILAMVLPGATAAPAGVCTLDRAVATRIDPQPFLRGAYGVRWNHATDRLAFMRPGPAGYYEVVTARSDGSDLRLPVDGRPEFGKHAGAVYWHPSGRYLLLVAQKPDWTGRKLFGIPDYEALPGFGRHDDLWLVRADGSASWRLTDDANTRDQGILIPVFSPDGRSVAWSARQPGGTYALKVADFVEAPAPHLETVRTYQPGGAAYYETGSFSSDGASLFYTSDQDTHSFWSSQIYRLDLATGTSVRLTAGKDYNEHPTVVATPGGDWLIYMSTRGAERFPGHLMLGTEWYAMRPDGSGAKRLTRMNVKPSEHPQFDGTMQVAGTVAVSPAGDLMLGDSQDSLVRQTGQSLRVHFACE